MHLAMADWIGIAVSSVFAFLVFGNISSKAGYPRWHGLRMAIPLLNLVAPMFFAFSTWNKVLRLEFAVSGQEGSVDHT
jgi:hypothetical protein